MCGRCLPTPWRQAALYTNEDLLWLTDHAGSFIVDRRHHLRAVGVPALPPVPGRRPDRGPGPGWRRARHHDYARPRTFPAAFSGRPDWAASHPYIQANLATHAARSGDIDDLAQDPGFLLAADPPPVLAALDTATSTPARAAPSAYRSALPLIRRHPPPAEHAAYLGLAARCGRAESLADHIDADDLASLWRARRASWRPQRLPASDSPAMTAR